MNPGSLDRAIELIQKHGNRTVRNRWNKTWNRAYSRAIDDDRCGIDASVEADKHLSQALTKDLGIKVSPYVATKWRQEHCPGWANGHIRSVATIPSIGAMRNIQPEATDDPIPAVLYMALQCFAMELCEYKFSQISGVFGISVAEVVGLINYAREQDHKWREDEVRRIINAAREVDGRGDVA